jgi:hypothetical protein
MSITKPEQSALRLSEERNMRFHHRRAVLAAPGFFDFSTDTPLDVDIEIRRTGVKAAFILPDGRSYVIDRSADQVSPCTCC